MEDGTTATTAEETPQQRAERLTAAYTPQSPEETAALTYGPYAAYRRKLREKGYLVLDKPR